MGSESLHSTTPSQPDERTSVFGLSKQTKAHQENAILVWDRTKIIESTFQRLNTGPATKLGSFVSAWANCCRGSFAPASGYASSAYMQAALSATQSLDKAYDNLDITLKEAVDGSNLEKDVLKPMRDGWTELSKYWMDHIVIESELSREKPLEK